jgi:hypothetical protein
MLLPPKVRVFGSDQTLLCRSQCKPLRSVRCMIIHIHGRTTDILEKPVLATSHFVARWAPIRVIRLNLLTYRPREDLSRSMQLHCTSSKHCFVSECGRARDRTLPVRSNFMPVKLVHHQLGRSYRTTRVLQFAAGPNLWGKDP